MSNQADRAGERVRVNGAAVSVVRRRRGDANKAKLKLAMESIFGAEAVEAEFWFHPDRKWRFDYAVPALKLAVEYQGHGQTGGKKHVGGHGSVVGISQDAEKTNAAMALGWRVIFFTALHFDARARGKHKLSGFMETLEQFKP